MNEMFKISVVVPTWKRPLKLEICLTHLLEQKRQADQIIIVLRAEDLEAVSVAERFYEKFSNFQIVYSHKVGVVAAENAGLLRVENDYVAFVDDDGYVPPDWLSKIELFFENYPDAFALGGSDIIKSEPWSYHSHIVKDVGLLKWYGKVVGNHHRKCIGGIRKVQVLKGVNMAFRRSAFSFLDERLSGNESNLGNGSQWELDLCLELMNKKLDIYFDPSLVVLHDSDHSQKDNFLATKNNTHNLSYVMIKHLNFPRYFVFLFYALIVGSEQLPGFFKFLMDLLKNRDISTVKMFYFKSCGFFQGIKTHLN